MSSSIEFGLAAAVGSMAGMLLDPISWLVVLTVSVAVRKHRAKTGLSKLVAGLVGASCVFAAMTMLQLALRSMAGDAMVFAWIIQSSILWAAIGGVIAGTNIAVFKRSARAVPESDSATP